jgi:hypothetical protein
MADCMPRTSMFLSGVKSHVFTNLHGPRVFEGCSDTLGSSAEFDRRAPSNAHAHSTNLYQPEAAGTEGTDVPLGCILRKAM